MDVLLLVVSLLLSIFVPLIMICVSYIALRDLYKYLTGEKKLGEIKVVLDVKNSSESEPLDKNKK